MTGASWQSWQQPSSLSLASLSCVQMPRDTSLTSTFRCQRVQPSKRPEASSGLMASQKSGPLALPQCAELSVRTRVAWSTQKPTVFGATARRSILVPTWVVRCRADCALHPRRNKVRINVAAASVAQHQGRLRWLSLAMATRKAACNVSRSGVPSQTPVAHSNTTCR